MRSVRKRALVVIERQFREQGGTGYIERMKLCGNRCAIGAVFAFNDGANEKDRCDLSYDDIDSLIKAHDETLREAVSKGLQGSEHMHDRPRALIGTPAYDLVWGEIEKWAASG